VSRARKTAVAVVAVAAIGLAWNGRGWLFYMWARWRESKKGGVKEVEAK